MHELTFPLFQMKMSSLGIGNVVLFGNRVGIIRYYGKVDQSDTVYAGIETFMSDGDYGNCDGRLNNIRYFNCKPNHGVFVNEKEIKRVITQKELLEKLSLLQTKQNKILKENEDCYQSFYSKPLCWYFDKLIRKWDIVYKIKKCKENRNNWIVKDCNGKCYVLNNNDLYFKPPSDKISLNEATRMTVQVLTQSIRNTNVCCMLYVYMYMGLVCNIHVGEMILFLSWGVRYKTLQRQIN